MKRLLICLAAVAFWAVDQTEVAAQSAPTGSYQSILSQSGLNGIAQSGNFTGSSYSQPVGNPGYPGITGGYQAQAGPAVVNQVPPMQTGPALGTGPNGAPVGVDGGVYGQGYGGCDSGCGSGCDGAVGCDVAACAPACRSRNWFYGLNGLVFNRDYEDDVYLTRDPMGNTLLSTDADTNTLGGLEFFFGSRNSCGNGFEVRYWGLFNDEATATLTGAASYATYLTDLQNVIYPTTGENLQTIFDRAETHTITRDNEIHNVEFNFLRRGGCFTTRTGRCGNYELLHGFRWFEFDEEFHWDVLNTTTAPNAIYFDTDVANTLLGYQLGSRASFCMTQRMAFNIGTKVGVYNNRARANQSIQDDLGVYATVNGTDYNFSDAKNDIAMLGEIDLGVSRLMSQCSRINLGYRAIGVSGVALAPDQYSNFNAVTPIRDVQSNGSLLLHGAYFGFEFCR